MQWLMNTYAPDGTKLHGIGKNLPRRRHLTYWNDTCWHRSVPQDCTGLTYLDVGCNEGLFLLRFEQSGGDATGLDFHAMGNITDSTDGVPVGEEYARRNYRKLKAMYKAKYTAYVGGFIENKIVPEDVGKFDIVSSFNVLEYMKHPREAVASLFAHAKDRVMIATDCCLDKKTHDPNFWIVRNIFNVKNILSWMEWPYVHWVKDLGGPEVGRHQVFITATKPKSKLAKVSGGPVSYDEKINLTETQKHRGANAKP